MEHIHKKPSSLRQKFNAFDKAKLNGFGTYEDFKKWYDSEKKVCHYCRLTEEESQRLVRFVLKSSRFPKDGLPGRGTSRGVHLEIDRRKPGKNNKYSKANCVLACYFCNNDKSDVFDDLQYSAFQKDRTKFLRELLKQQTKK
jgi:hypothetical protein